MYEAGSFSSRANVQPPPAAIRYLHGQRSKAKRPVVGTGNEVKTRIFVIFESSSLQVKQSKAGNVLTCVCSSSACDHHAPS